MRISLILFSLLFAAGLNAGIYRWVDDQGNVVYSQTPPPDARPAEKLRPPPPPAEDPQTARQRLNEQLETLEKSAEERRKKKERLAKEKARQEQRQKACEIARKNLETLSTRPPNSLFKTGDGEYRRYTIEELEQKKAEMRKAIEKYCNPE